MRASIWIVGSRGFALLLCLPILALLLEASLSSTELLAHLWATVLPTYLLNSVALVCGTLLLCLLLGAPAGWLMARCQLPGRRWLNWALVLPLAMPGYLVAYVYTDLFDYAGAIQLTLRQLFGWQQPADYYFPPIRSLGGAVVVLSLVLYPYVYLLSRAGFGELAPQLIESARMQGYGRWRCWWHLELPLVRPAIAVGLSLVAMETLADYGTVSYFAVPTLTTAVNDVWLGYGDLGAAAQIALGLLGCVLLILLMERMSRGRQQRYQRHSQHQPTAALELGPVAQVVAVGYLLVLVLLGFLLPCLVLVQYAWQAGSDAWPAGLADASLNSLQVAGWAALVATIMALLILFAQRLAPRPGLSRQWAGLGYAMPGTVLAIGILIPLTATDFGINALLAGFGLAEPGLILTGSLFALIAAYVVRFIVMALGAMESSYGRISPSLDMAGRALGHGPASLLWRVHLPLLRRGALTGALLIFIEAMKELPAALMLRPFSYETLATLVYQYVKTEQLAEGALPALLIVAVGLLPLLFMNHYLGERKS